MLANNKHILRSTGRRCILNSRCFNSRRNRTIGSYRFTSTEAKGSSLTSASTEKTMQEQQEAFLKSYKIRSSLERLIYHYAQIPLTSISLDGLCEQSKDLSSSSILQYARDTVESLLTYNARRIREFRNLPYLVVLNPSISESYNIYLETMHSLITASLNLPTTLEENEKFCNDVLNGFIDIHADTLPGLSKGFDEVSRFLGVEQTKQFLDEHLKERICMRLIAHQHIELSNTLKDKSSYVKGSKYNGVIKELNIPNVIKKSAELVNDICSMKYDQTVQIEIDTNLYPPNYWSGKAPELKPKSNVDNFIFPYIEFHLDYILMELFKNSFRAHIENNVLEPIRITISISNDPAYLELRIRDKGKGIKPATLNHMFDYSYSTYESNEGESFKTLNVPPGLGGNTIAGIGYGLPLLKNYVEIFNDTSSQTSDGEAKTKGLLTVQSYYGWGTDVYLKILGT
ncbi:uncharacterized protein AC631_04431 [Debaryomyces fabryi]|uniref:Protein-serine/threonine kinase n=1 Tax=Debaryomyces fabryi TaxID=58627 RepID=A0A0V1PUZ3_9ASCO|nr:uncharacterized protein AC631_04431 [Debaryomyces fabryi]KRZ99806.1 hypothetical protein AC631_04431 [Debaryomyces fabryi]CUM49284.1 unnamed protein product [Debaryomyces fabryi]